MGFTTSLSLNSNVINEKINFKHYEYLLQNYTNQIIGQFTRNQEENHSHQKLLGILSNLRLN